MFGHYVYEAFQHKKKKYSIRAREIEISNYNFQGKPVWPVRNLTDSSIFWMIGGSRKVQAASSVSFLFPFFLERSKATLLAEYIH